MFISKLFGDLRLVHREEGMGNTVAPGDELQSKKGAVVVLSNGALLQLSPGARMVLSQADLDGKPLSPAQIEAVLAQMDLEATEADLVVENADGSTVVLLSSGSESAPHADPNVARLQSMAHGRREDLVQQKTAKKQAAADESASAVGGGVVAGDGAGDGAGSAGAGAGVGDGSAQNGGAGGWVDFDPGIVIGPDVGGNGGGGSEVGGGDGGNGGGGGSDVGGGDGGKPSGESTPMTPLEPAQGSDEGKKPSEPTPPAGGGGGETPPPPPQKEDNDKGGGGGGNDEKDAEKNVVPKEDPKWDVALELGSKKGDDQPALSPGDVSTGPATTPQSFGTNDLANRTSEQAVTIQTSVVLHGGKLALYVLGAGFNEKADKNTGVTFTFDAPGVEVKDKTVTVQADSTGYVAFYKQITPTFSQEAEKITINMQRDGKGAATKIYDTTVKFEQVEVQVNDGQATANFGKGLKVKAGSDDNSKVTDYKGQAMNEMAVSGTQVTFNDNKYSLPSNIREYTAAGLYGGVDKSGGNVVKVLEAAPLNARFFGTPLGLVRMEEIKEHPEKLRFTSEGDELTVKIGMMGRPQNLTLEPAGGDMKMLDQQSQKTLTGLIKQANKGDTLSFSNGYSTASTIDGALMGGDRVVRMFNGEVQVLEASGQGFGPFTIKVVSSKSQDVNTNKWNYQDFNAEGLTITDSSGQEVNASNGKLSAGTYIFDLASKASEIGVQGMAFIAYAVQVGEKLVKLGGVQNTASMGDDATYPIKIDIDDKGAELSDIKFTITKITMGARFLFDDVSKYTEHINDPIGANSPGLLLPSQSGKKGDSTYYYEEYNQLGYSAEAPEKLSIGELFVSQNGLEPMLNKLSAQINGGGSSGKSDESGQLIAATAATLTQGHHNAAYSAYDNLRGYHEY